LYRNTTGPAAGQYATCGGAAGNERIMTTKPSPITRPVRTAKAGMAGQRYGASDKPFVCRFCGHDRFRFRRLLVLSMHTLTCVGCSHIEFFAQKPKSVEP